MKNLICLCCTLFFVGRASAQTNDLTKDSLLIKAEQLNQSKNNELRINLAMCIYGFPELQYERLIADNVGLGFSAGFSLESPENMIKRSEFLSFCRVYFGKRKAAGFFIEGNLAVVSEREIYDEEGSTWYYPYVTPSQHVDNSYVSMGMGASVGVKLLTKNDFVGEIYGGGGRLFGESANGGYGRFGICIGKRF